MNSTQKLFFSHEFPKSPKKNQRNKRYENIYRKIQKFHTKNCSALIKILKSTQKHFLWREFPKIKVKNEDQSTNKIQIMGFPVERAFKNYKKIKLRVKKLIFR